MLWCNVFPSRPLSVCTMHAHQNANAAMQHIPVARVVGYIA